MHHPHPDGFVLNEGEQTTCSSSRCWNIAANEATISGRIHVRFLYSRVRVRIWEEIKRWEEAKKLESSIRRSSDFSRVKSEDNVRIIVRPLDRTRNGEEEV